jgi:hypothetical protein
MKDDALPAGNTSQTCGGPYSQLTVYNTTTAPSGPAKPAGWKGESYDFARHTEALNSPNDVVLGCYNSSLAFPYSYYSGDMTSALCRRTCANQGYTLAATQNGYRKSMGSLTAERSTLIYQHRKNACAGAV